MKQDILQHLFADARVLRSEKYCSASFRHKVTLDEIDSKLWQLKPRQGSREGMEFLREGQFFPNAVFFLQIWKAIEKKL